MIIVPLAEDNYGLFIIGLRSLTIGVSIMGARNNCSTFRVCKQRY